MKPCEFIIRYLQKDDYIFAHLEGLSAKELEAVNVFLDKAQQMIDNALEAAKPLFVPQIIK